MPPVEVLEHKTNLYFVIFSIFLTALVAFILVKINLLYAFVAAIGLGILVVTFTNTDFAIYILILSMLLSPEFGQRSTIGEGVTIRIDDILLAIIIFTWLAKTAINKELGLFRKTVLNKPIVIYLIVCLLSTTFGMIAGRVKILTGAMFLLKYVQYFLVYFMTINNIRSIKQIDKYFIALIITYVIVTFSAIAQIPTGRRVTAPFEGDAGEPNTLGGYLIFIIALNLSLTLTPGVLQNSNLRRALLVITALSIVPYLLTNSRGSWAAGIPVVIAYVFLSHRRWIIIGFCAVLVVLAPFIMPKAVIDRVKYTFTPQTGYAAKLQERIGDITIDTSASERIRSWRAALKDLPQHPLLGFGITGWRFLDAQYMRVLIETGVAGLVAFLYLLFSILNNSFKIYKNSQIPFLKALAMGFFVGTLAMATHGIGANTFIIIRIMEPFWLVCGLVMAIPEVEKIELEKLQQMEAEAARLKLGYA